MTIDTIQKGQAVHVEPSTPKKKGRFNWEDPAVPVGNAPPFPKWPLVIATLAWVVWVVFLFVMMSRVGFSAVS